MTDWDLVAKIAGGGFGVTILVLIILSLVAWGMGLVIQKTARATTESKGNSEKE
jgi:Na+-transporting methylmalonyl-CoA/oxaloacetate decarboxylase gamma subunit|tara:strand:- start:547 stop:708 length:162 start_codon:yes stop_codon:yes gene_type:complete